MPRHPWNHALAHKNVYQRLRLTQRANQAATLPTIDVVDMRQEVENGNVFFFHVVARKLQERLEKTNKVFSYLIAVAIRHL